VKKCKEWIPRMNGIFSKTITINFTKGITYIIKSLGNVAGATSCFFLKLITSSSETATTRIKYLGTTLSITIEKVKIILYSFQEYQEQASNAA
jgi:hypothetical protein